MAMLYANRGFLSINNQRLVDIKSLSVKVNKNARAVNTMTPDGFNRGFTQGQAEIDLTFQVAVQNSLSSPKLEFIDYSTTDVQATATFGSDQYTVTGLFLVDSDESAPSVGEEVTKTYNMKGLKIIDNIGNSILFKLLS